MLTNMQRLVATGELRKIFRMTAKRVHEITQKPDFPEPAAAIGVGRIWETEAVLEFARATRRKAWDPDMEDVVLYDPETDK